MFKVDKPNPIQDLYAAATKYVGIAAVLIFVPFATNNFFQGRTLLGMLSLAVIAVLVTNALVTQHKKYSSLLTFFLQVPIILFFLVTAFFQQGVIGALWCAPAVLSFYFMLPERLAWLATFILIVTATVSSWLVLEPAIAWRVVATLCATAIFSAIFLRIIRVQQKQLRHLAITDPLTGLNNRMMLQSTLEQALNVHQRTNNPMTLLSIDLDHFKAINDQYGHDVGDQVLVEVAAALKNQVRASDSVFRIGGEEFCCLLFNADGQQKAEEILTTISQLHIPDCKQVTASIGLAKAAENYDWKSWLVHSDQALYNAKIQGRNQIVVAA
ncbi:MAG: GGDEF domain-containing protein [Paraglaciecola sp.]|nr:GGDEF domain-containing protein [Paraglaciecola sp.]NCT48987.1 GGDEF domain-containing protein [Paraglaciecola sp.]